MKCYSLFCGIGGFDLALKNTGHEVLGACEIDKYARQTYKKNFGREPEQRDATKIIPEQLPDFDLLCAGFPCYGLFCMFAFSPSIIESFIV